MIAGNPVIGILAARYHKTFFKVDYSVYKWLNSCGAIVLYIDPRLSYERLRELIMNLDGIIIPGGGDHPYETSPTYQTAKLIFQIAEELENFPILGICMGIQYMLTYYSGSNWDNVKTVINNFGYSNKNRIVAPLEYTFLGAVPKQWITSNHLVFNHRHAILMDTFQKFKSLGETFQLLTTSSYKHLNFVSSIQGRIYPFFGIQWHPEKPAYEWSPKQNIKRESEAIEIGQIVGDTFVEYCRGTKHKTNLDIFLEFNINRLRLTSNRYLKLDDPDYYDEPLIKFIFE